MRSVTDDARDPASFWEQRDTCVDVCAEAAGRPAVRKKKAVDDGMRDNVV